MARGFKVHTVNSDGSEADNTLIAYEVLDPDTGKPYQDEKGNKTVIVQLHPVTNTKYRQIVDKHTSRIPARKGQPPTTETDWDAVTDAVADYAIESWVGIVGADDKPLACMYETKVNLPGDLKNELVRAALQGSGVDLPASFRSVA